MTVLDPFGNLWTHQVFAHQGKAAGSHSCHAEDAVFVAASGPHLKGRAEIRPGLD